MAASAITKTSSQGIKRQYEEDDTSSLPGPKRHLTTKELEALDDAEFRSPITMGAILPRTELQLVKKKLTTKAPAPAQTGFPQFRKLPLELQRLIWHHTWEHRRVRLNRVITGYSQNPAKITFHPDPNNIIDIAFGARDMRAIHNRIIRRNMGVASAFWHDDHEVIAHVFRGRYIDTETTTSMQHQPPASFWVCRDSREDSERHFEYGVLRMSGGWSDVWFNFALDRLHFASHSPLAAAFRMADLRRLVRLQVPELVPCLPGFATETGAWDTELAVEVIKDYGDADADIDIGLCHPEFRNVWRLLHRFFPALREVDLDSFVECGRYESNRLVSYQMGHIHPLDIERDPGIHGIRTWDVTCHACLNVQRGVRTRFPLVGVMAEGWQTRDDVERVLDHHGITDLKPRREKMVIGKVQGPRGGRGPEEEISVTFLAYEDNDEEQQDETNVFDVKRRPRDWDKVKRQCVARTLEHALGPPDELEYALYRI